MRVNYYPVRKSGTYAWVSCHFVVDDFGNELFIGNEKSEALAWYFLGVERALL